MSEATTKELKAESGPSSVRLILTLGLIAMMSGLLIVVTYQLTLPRIEQNKREAMARAVFKVLPDAVTRVNYRLSEDGLTKLSPEEDEKANVFAGYDAEGRLAGLAMQGAARGYQDVVVVLYGYSLKEQAVIGMTVLQSTETPGLGDKVETDPEFLANFEALEARLNAAGTAMAHEIVTVKNGKKTEPWQIDGISGATVTSTAIGTALRTSTNEMLPLLGKYEEALEPTIELEDKSDG